MIVRDHPALTEDAARAFCRQLDAGGSAASLTLYSGTVPSTFGASPPVDNTILAVLTLGYPSFSSYAGGVVLLSAIADVLASGTGDATWGRFKDSTGRVITDVDVGAIGEGCAVTIQASTRTIYAGGTVRILTVQRSFS